MTQLEYLADSEAFDRDCAGMQRQTIQVAKRIAVTPSRHTLSLQVFTMIKTVATLSTRKSIDDPDPIDWTAEEWAKDLLCSRSSAFKVLHIATAAGAIRGRFGALFLDRDGLRRWVLREEPTEVTLTTIAAAKTEQRSRAGKRSPSAPRTETEEIASAGRTLKSAPRTPKSAPRIPTYISTFTTTLPQGEPPSETADDPWRVVVSELESLKPPMKRAGKAVGAAQSRGLEPADVRQLIEFYEHARALLAKVTIGYLYRWMTGESDPEDLRAELPPDPSQTSLMDRDTQATMIRVRTVRRGRKQGASPEAIERAVQANLQRAGLQPSPKSQNPQPQEASR